MANEIPSNLSYGTVTGRFLLAYADSNDIDPYPDGIAAKGTVFFTPSPANIKDVAATPAPVTILPASAEAVLDDEGYLCGYGTTRGIRLLATDDPSGNPVDWTWTAEFRLTDQGGITVPLSSFSFSLPSDETVDLSVLGPVASADGTYYITGPANELTVGSVTTVVDGNPAEVEITGVSPNQTINFTIPAGPQGPPGNLSNLNVTSPITYDIGTSTVGFSGLALDDITDVNASTPNIGDTLYWDGTSWIASGLGLDQLSNVVASTPNIGDTLYWDGTSWISQELNLENLTNVNLDGSQNIGDIIAYDGIQWVNQKSEQPLPTTFMMMGA